MVLGRPLRPVFDVKKTFSRQKRSAMDNFFRTYRLQLTVRIVEENSLVDLFSGTFKQLAFFPQKKKSQEYLPQKKKTGVHYVPSGVQAFVPCFAMSWTVKECFCRKTLSQVYAAMSSEAFNRREK